MNNNQIFISFSSKETDEANRVCAFLEENGYTCFISHRDLVAGEEYAGQLVENISNSKAVVLLMSNESNHSQHVLREVEYAVSKRIPILVYTLEKVDLSKSMEYYLMTHQWIPLESDRDERLLEGLKNIDDKKIFSPLDLNNPQSKSDHTSFETAKKTNRFVMMVLLVLLVGTLVGALLFISMNGKKTSENKSSKPSESITPGANDEITGSITITPAPGNASYSIGDTVTFGNFNGEPIEWRVLKVENGNAMLISNYILSMKTFDAAEGGSYGIYNNVDYSLYVNHIITDHNTQIMARGNNDWSKSNLREWLNSDKEKVEYLSAAPNLQAVKHNPYSNDHGFLFDFTEEEKNAIVPMTIVTPVNSLNEEANNGYITTTDYVSLLSSEDLHLLTEAGMTIYAKPSDACIANDENPEGYASHIAQNNTKTYYWWLRDLPKNEDYPDAEVPPADNYNLLNHVASEVEEPKQVFYDSVGICTYGVRPVIWIKE